MKKCIKLCVLLCMLVVLCAGCGDTKNELKNRLIIQAIGIDEKDGKVQVTLQTLNTEMTGNPNSGANLGDVINSMTVTGKSVSDAISNISKSQGKIPLLTQNRLIVFGRETAKQGLYTHLDYFVRNAENRATVLVAVSDTTAEELVSAKKGESVLMAESMEKILQASRLNTNVVQQELYAFMNLLDSEVTDAYLPILKAEKASEEETTIELLSVGVFKADKLDYDLTEAQIPALLFLTNQVGSGYFTVENPDFDSELVLKIENSKTKIHPMLQGGKISFQIQIDLKTILVENRAAKPFPLSEDYILSTKRYAEQSISDTVHAAVKACFLQHNSDPFNLGRRFTQKNWKYFRDNIRDWSAILPNVNVQVETKVDIDRIGNSVNNL